MVTFHDAAWSSPLAARRCGDAIAGEGQLATKIRRSLSGHLRARPGEGLHRSLSAPAEMRRLSNAESLGAPPRTTFALQAARPTTGGKAVARRWLYNLVSSERFDGVMGIFIICNAIAIGFEVDHRTSQIRRDDAGDVDWASDGIVYSYLEAGFLLVFCLELGVRMYVFRCAYFGSFVNIGDSLIVFAGIVAAVLQVKEYSGNASQTNSASNVRDGMRAFSLTRLGRLLRVVRIVRLVSQFRSLWRIVQGLAGCMNAVMWTAVLLGAVTYSFAVIAVEGVRSDAGIAAVRFDDNNRTVQERFSNLGTSFVTLFEFFAIDKVSEKGFPIMQKQPWVIIFLLAFVLLVPIVLLNLITAVVVEMSINSAKRDDEHLRVLELENWAMICQELELIFFAMVTETCAMNDSPPPTSGQTATDERQDASVTPEGSLERAKNSMSGTLKQAKTLMTSLVSPTRTLCPSCSAEAMLTREQVQRICESSKTVRDKLNLLFSEPENSERGITRLMELWTVLDADGDGTISLEEFTDGLGRLHGIISGRSADSFMLLRLMRLLEQARTERQEQMAFATKEQLALGKQEHRRQAIFAHVDSQLRDLDLSVQALEQAQKRTDTQLETLAAVYLADPTGVRVRSTEARPASPRVERFQQMSL